MSRNASCSFSGGRFYLGHVRSLEGRQRRWESKRADSPAQDAWQHAGKVGSAAQKAQVHGRAARVHTPGEGKLCPGEAVPGLVAPNSPSDLKRIAPCCEPHFLHLLLQPWVENQGRKISSKSEKSFKAFTSLHCILGAFRARPGLERGMVLLAVCPWASHSRAHFPGRVRLPWDDGFMLMLWWKTWHTVVVQWCWPLLQPCEKGSHQVRLLEDKSL